MASSTTMSIQDIIDMYQGLQDQANAANEQRYQDILNLFQGQGDTSKAMIDRSVAEQNSQDRQSLASRGLFNSTIQDVNRNQRTTTGNLAKSQIDENVAMNKAGVMERKTELGPDAGFYTTLLQMIGQNQGMDQNQRSYSFQ